MHLSNNFNCTLCFQKLKQPWFTPPEIAFPIVWSGLFAGMGYASYMVYRDGGGFEGAARTPLMIYGAKLAVNWAFTPLYFGAKKLGWVNILLFYTPAHLCLYCLQCLNEIFYVFRLPLTSALCGFWSE